MKLFRPSSTKNVPARRTASAQAQPEMPPGYRRNRTLPGHQAVIDETSARSHAHRLRARRKRLFTLLASVSLGLAVVLLLLTQFTAKASVIAGDTAMVGSLDTAAYSKAFNDYFAGHPLERFRFATNIDRLRTEVQKTLPEVAGIVVHGFAGLGETQYEVKLRKPMAGWVIGGTQYYVDASGATFERNYYQAPSVQIVDNSGASSPDGKAVASKRLLSFVGRVVSLASKQGFTVTQIEIPPESARTIYVHIDGTPTIYMTIDGGAERQVNEMQQGIRTLSARGESASYLDVRVEGRVFYK